MNSTNFIIEGMKIIDNNYNNITHSFHNCILDFISYFTGKFTIDRNNIFNKHSKYRVHHIKNYVDLNSLEFKRFSPINEELDINDILISSAKYIIDIAKKENKKIYFSWSGGIDSTAALCAFLNFDITNYLIVLSTATSKQENPNFFEKIKKYIQLYDADNFYLLSNSLIKNNMYVTCTGAGLLFESDTCFDYIHSLNENWKDFFLKNSFDCFEKKKLQYINQLEDYFYKLNIQVNTTYLLFRLLDFFFKIDSSFNEVPHLLKTQKNIYNFYNSLQFQQYAYNRYFSVRETVTNNLRFKQPLKKFIYYFNKDMDYYKSKGKVKSRYFPPDGQQSIYKISVLDNNGSYTHFRPQYYSERVRELFERCKCFKCYEKNEKD